jgi:TonB-linked SusC/RagA family outer membrane protein
MIKKLLSRLSTAILVSVLFTFPVMAQFTVSGKVVDQETGESLVGVTVVLKNTTIGTSTDINGEFKLEIPGERGVIQVSYIGYRSQDINVNPSSSPLTIQLKEDFLGLEEVVVTGLATTVKRQNLANSVSTVSGDELSGTTESSTIENALYGKIPGAEISSNSGAPGGGYSVKLRGVTTINGSSQPLYIVDGVYLDNSAIPAGLNAVTRAAAGGSSSNQDNPSNRIADLNPDDIESIEVLKGASAAAIYGARASNGVVIINTKRGSAGDTQVSVSQSFGVTQMSNKLGTREFTEATAEAAFGTTGLSLFQQAQQQNQFYNYEDEMYGNKGLLYNTNISLRGGNDQTSFFVSGLFKDEEGIVKNTGYGKESIRANLDHKISNNIDLSVSSSYIHSTADRGLTNNDNTGRTFGVSLTASPNFINLLPDDNGNYPDHPFNPANPIQTRDLMTNQEEVNRVLTSAKLNADLMQRDNQVLSFVLEGGIDFFNQQNKAIFPRALQFERISSSPGTSIIGETQTTSTNVRGLFIHTYNPAEKLTLVTQAGITLYDYDQNRLVSVAQDLIGTQTNVDQAASVQTTQTRQFQTDRGFFAQEEVNYDDTFILTAGFRGDKSSLNGDVNKMYYYPKASFAWNVSNMDFWSIDPIDQFKLRFAFGQSGNFATFGAKYTSLGPANIGGNAGVLIGTRRGSEDIKPEQQTELETGFDLSFLDGLGSLEFTLYQKTIQDLLLQRDLEPSTGFSFESFNAGELVNKGMEVSLNLNPIANRDFNWLSRINFWTNSSEVTELTVPPFTAGGFGATLAIYQVEEGKSATQIVGIDPVQTGNGVEIQTVPLGDGAPDFQMSFINELNFLGSFNLSVNAHWKQGGDNINLSELLFDLSQTTPDYDDTDLNVSDLRAQTAGIDPDDTNGVKRTKLLGVSAAHYVQDASYFRIREVGLYYTVPGQTLEKIFGSSVRNMKFGVSGNNLLTFTPYKSYDPEVSNFGSQPIAGGIEVMPYPSSKQYYFHFSVDF